MNSKYCYPDSVVLRNKLNLREEEPLARAERKLVLIRLGELKIRPVAGDFSERHLRDIHFYLFQDLYEFAGQFRDEQLGKGFFRFASPLYFQDMFQELTRNLQNENYLQNMDKKLFSCRLAYYMAEWNVVHPFREGNGRAIREYIRTLALSGGYTLDWSRADKEELYQATVQSIANTTHLTKVLYSLIVEDEPNPVLIKKWQQYKNAAQ